MLLRAAREYALDLEGSYMIGDSRRDVEAGEAAGLARSILIGCKLEGTEQWAGDQDLAQAVRFILGGAA
jgi:D-glycero-D-manno-heptose 1,7-bisphosphate phosphatase